MSAKCLLSLSLSLFSDVSLRDVGSVLAAEARHGDGLLDGSLAFGEPCDALLDGLDLAVLELHLHLELRIRRVEPRRIVRVALTDEDRLVESVLNYYYFFVLWFTWFLVYHQWSLLE